MEMSESLSWLRMYVALPLGAIFLVLGTIQGADENRGDMSEFGKRVILVGATVALISIFPEMVGKMTAITDNLYDQNEKLTQLLIFQHLFSEVNSNIVETGAFSFFTPSGVMDLFGYWMKLICVGLIYLILFIPSMVGFYLANVLVKAVLLAATAFSPLFLSMIPLRQTSQTGFAFLLSTFFLSLSMLALVFFDQVLRTSSEAVIIALLPVGVGAGATAAGTGESLMSVATVISGGTTGLGTLTMVAGVLLIAGLIILVLMTAMYVLVPFAFVKFGLSGSVLGLAGAMTGAAQVGRGVAMPLIEGGEAIGRSSRAQRRASTGAAVLAAETGVETPAAARAISAAGGDMHLAKRSLELARPAPAETGVVETAAPAPMPGSAGSAHMAMQSIELAKSRSGGKDRNRT